MKTLSVAVLAACALLFAADPWKSKKPEDWSSKDAQRVLSDSPWARKATAEMNFSAMGGPEGSGGPGGGGGRGMGGPGGGGGGMGGPGGGMGGPGGGMGGPGGGMGGPEGGMGGPLGGGGNGMQTPKVTVRWESAEPVRVAMSRIEHPAAAQLAEWSKNFYVVSLSGMGPRRHGGPGGRGPEPDDARRQEMHQRLLAATSLRLKTQDPIKPERVEMIEGPDGMLTAFLFPRSTPLKASDNQVQFETSMGPMQIKARFGLKEMQWLGNPAL